MKDKARTVGRCLNELSQLLASMVALNGLGTVRAKALGSSFAVVAAFTPPQEYAWLVLDARRALSASILRLATQV